MEAVDHQPSAEGSHPAWEPLDDALQILVRAQSVVMLLECASDVEEHHRYCAQIACDELSSLKRKISEALAQIRRPRSQKPSRPARQAGPRTRGAVDGIAAVGPTQLTSP